MQVNLHEQCQPSKSGKSSVLAGTRGFQAVGNSRLSITLWTKCGREIQIPSKNSLQAWDPTKEQHSSYDQTLSLHMEDTSIVSSIKLDTDARKSNVPLSVSSSTFCVSGDRIEIKLTSRCRPVTIDCESHVWIDLALHGSSQGVWAQRSKSELRLKFSLASNYGFSQSGLSTTKASTHGFAKIPYSNILAFVNVYCRVHGAQRAPKGPASAMKRRMGRRVLKRPACKFSLQQLVPQTPAKRKDQSANLNSPVGLGDLYKQFVGKRSRRER